MSRWKISPQGSVLMGRKDIASSFHYLPLSHFPSNLCPVAFLLLIRDGWDKTHVSLQGAWHVCKQLSCGKALSVSRCELADTKRKMLTYSLCRSLQSVVLCTQTLLPSWGFTMFFKHAPVCVGFQCHLVGCDFISLVGRVSVKTFQACVCA